MDSPYKQKRIRVTFAKSEPICEAPKARQHKLRELGYRASYLSSQHLSKNN